MDFSYCRRCGTKLIEKVPGAYLCANQHEIFVSPVPGSSVFLIDDECNVYLTRRGREPGKGMLGALGGFVDFGESSEEAAIREIEEESGLTTEDYGPLHYLCSTASTYSFQGNTIPIVGALFWAKLHDSQVKTMAGDDVASIEKVPLNEVEPSLFYGHTIRTGFARLQEVMKNYDQTNS